MNPIGMSTIRTPAFSSIRETGTLLVAAVALVCGSLNAGEQTKSADRAPRLDFSLLDTDGVAHSLRGSPERSALALVFLSTECPIANAYVSELNRQFAALREAEAKVAYYGVVSSSGTTRAAA